MASNMSGNDGTNYLSALVKAACEVGFTLYLHVGPLVTP